MTRLRRSLWLARRAARLALMSARALIEKPREYDPVTPSTADWHTAAGDHPSARCKCGEDIPWPFHDEDCEWARVHCPTCDGSGHCPECTGEGIASPKHRARTAGEERADVVVWLRARDTDARTGSQALAEALSEYASDIEHGEHDQASMGVRLRTAGDERTAVVAFIRDLIDKERRGTGLVLSNRAPSNRCSYAAEVLSLVADNIEIGTHTSGDSL